MPLCRNLANNNNNNCKYELSLKMLKNLLKVYLLLMKNRIQRCEIN